MDPPNKVPRFGKRHVQAFLMFALYSIGIGMRVQISVALVAMTEKNTSTNPDVPVFDWKNKGFLLSSFYWGYPWLQVLAGNLGRIYGTKYFLLLAMTINATICCLIPFVVIQWGSYGLITMRVLQGLSQGFFYPSFNNVLSKWSPLSERATLGNFVVSGSPFGNIISMPLVALLSSTWYGWPLSFYVFGGIGYVWVIIFFFFGASSPDSHRTISQAEREYIKSGLVTQNDKVKIPWKKIICNIPFWALFVVQVGTFFSGIVLLLETPTYLHKVFKFDLTSNGFLSASPYLVGFFLSNAFGCLADYIINKNIVSMVWTRKIFTAIGCVLPAAAILILGYLPDNQSTLSVIMLIAAAGAATACGSGAMINQYDLSPNFAGVIIGITNSCGSIVSILGPILVQYIVEDETNKSEWRIIFIIAAIMYLIPCIIFVIFASADVQDYNYLKEDDIEIKTQKLR